VIRPTGRGQQWQQLLTGSSILGGCLTVPFWSCRRFPLLLLAPPLQLLPPLWLLITIIMLLGAI
jgi:hypothetical protein